MTHGCEEGRFRLRRFECAGVGFDQRQLGFLARRDVHQRAGKAHRLAVWPHGRVGARMHPNPVSVLAAQATLDIKSSAALDRGKAFRDDLFPPVGVESLRIARMGTDIFIRLKPKNRPQTR